MTHKITLNNAYEKYNPLIDSYYASIIDAFGKNNQSQLLKTSSTIVSNNILYIVEHNEINMKYYEYLCPYLNSEFKSTLFQNSKEDILKLDNAYKQIKSFCKSR